MTVLVLMEMNFMKYQSTGSVRSDEFMTPPWMCSAVVRHFGPSGRVMEPCAGTGNMVRALRDAGLSVETCELTEGRPFHSWFGKVDWVVTNPPWSKVAEFLRKSMQVADEVVFIITVNHAFTTARVRDAREAGFGLKEILYLPWPPEWVKSGFQLGALRWSRGWDGDCKICASTSEI